jgi:CBS domain-containing protein/anti-sigma regulatory factor (Ser/Thr protein kinase)
MAPENDKFVIIDDHEAESISRLEELSYELRISEVMTKEVKTLNPDMIMKDVLVMFRTARISGAPVLDDNNQPVGILSIEDLIRCMGQNDLDETVGKYMTGKIISVKTFDPVVKALNIFVKSNIGRLPVLDDNDILVGILTKGDITRGLLNALKRDYESEELRRYRASHLFEDIISDRSSLILRYRISAKDFTKGGSASSHIKKALLRLGASSQLARQIAIAVYEAEMNLIIHTTNGGEMIVEIEPHQISIETIDDGPGIEDINLALQPGYSTATPEIQELGFGAGMGLVNISRCMDQMVLESEMGIGTHLTMKLFINKEEKFGEGYPSQKEVVWNEGANYH